MHYEDSEKGVHGGCWRCACTRVRSRRQFCRPSAGNEFTGGSTDPHNGEELYRQCRRYCGGVVKPANIIGVTLTGKKIRRALQGHTSLAECELNGQVTSANLPDGGVEFRKPLSFQRRFRAASLVERFLPTPDSVWWEVDVECGATRLPWPPFTQMEPWSTAIETHLKWPEAKSAKFWIAWGDNFSSKIVENMDSSGMAWIDPTVLQPFREMQLLFGGHCSAGPGFSVPIATIIEESNASEGSSAEPGLSPQTNEYKGIR